MQNGRWIWRWTRWRNRVLASEAFQHWALRVPGMRTIARSKAGRTFDLVSGFVHSQTLAAFVALGWIERLREPVGVETLAGESQLSPDAAERLLLAGASVGLAQRVGDRWTLGEVGAAISGNRGIAEMVTHHAALYADMADPVALLRRRGGGALAAAWRYAESPGKGDADEVADYSRLMAASQPLVSGQILDAYRFDRHRRVLDVGGGQGVFAAALVQQFPDVAACVFDLPAVVDRIGDVRIGRHGGDFLRDDLPRGYDAITLVRILHDHDDDGAMRLLCAAYAALPDGGTIVIAEPMADTRGALAMGHGYFGWYLWAMGSGRPRSKAEIAQMLRRAGFEKCREHRTLLPLTTRVISARRLST